ncbi:MAG: nucleoside kinase [Bacteroidales bacterium]|jgi:uridine kinase|nr:nucleoside kinase [Bacteroidales bacterium]
MVEIYCVNNNKKVFVSEGTNLFEVIRQADLSVMQEQILGAYVNNKVQNMYYNLFSPKRVEFITLNNANGRRMYAFSLMFVMYRAVKELFPQGELRIEHSLSEGYYTEVQNVSMQPDEMVTKLKNRMLELIAADIKFDRKIEESANAAVLFDAVGMKEKAELVRERQKIYTKVDCLGETINSFFFELVPSTSYLKEFDLKAFNRGMILVMPNSKKVSATRDNSKLFSVFQEHKHWIEILQTPYVKDLNADIVKGLSSQKRIIQISEALHEKKYVEIADSINRKRNEIKFVFLAGPSSSGKTTSCRRIATQLAVLGFDPLEISLDDYFVDREFTPKDKDGNLDFEALDALDLRFFNSQMQDLLAGKEIRLPKFDFYTGKRGDSQTCLQMKENSILIIEGIHALNPKLSHGIERKHKYNVFVSALTQIAIDRHNLISTSDNRLLRRIVRDNNFRGYSAEETISRWQSVRDGEEKHIFPFQENADSIFNSSLLYEISVLKPFVEPLLANVPQKSLSYAEARRLQNFLSLFKPINNGEFIPPTSIMREFLGGSSFDY